MTQQEDGWPLGLQPFNVRVGLVRNPDYSGSISFNTLLTGSPCSCTDSSSDLDTESTGSFFHDKSITLGSLIGVSSILEVPGRSGGGRRRRRREALRSKMKSCRSKTWWFSVCARADDISDGVNNSPSLGHFLEEEKRAANDYSRNQSPIVYQSPWFDPDVSGSGTSHKSLENGYGFGVPLLFSCSCMCGQPSN